MATCSTLQENPTVVTLAAAEHCVNLSEHDKSMPLKVPNVFQDMIGLSFLWVPHVSRSVLFVWAQEAFAVHVAATTEAFEDLPYYCAGDVPRLDNNGPCRNAWCTGTPRIAQRERMGARIDCSGGCSKYSSNHKNQCMLIIQTQADSRVLLWSLIQSISELPFFPSFCSPRDVEENLF